MRERVVPDKCCSRILGHSCCWLLCCCVPVLRVPCPFFCRRALVLVAECHHLISSVHVSRVAGATRTIRKRIPVPCKGLHTQMTEPAPVPAWAYTESPCLIAHAPIRVLERRDDGIGVPRKRRRRQLAQHLQGRLAHVLIGVVEPQSLDAGVQRERRRLQVPPRLHRRLAHGTIGVLEAQSLDAGVLRERRRLQLAQAPTRAASPMPPGARACRNSRDGRG